jgi:outer membrane protein assembly factor BamB
MGDLPAQFPMQSAPSEVPSEQNEQVPPKPRSLRLWPAVVIVALQWLVMSLPGWLELGGFAQFMGKFWGPIVGTFLLMVWWMFFSRRFGWIDHLVVLVLCASGALVKFAYDPTFIFMPFIIYTLPAVTTAFVVWLVLTTWMKWPARRVGLFAVVLTTWAFFGLLRVEGLDGSFSMKFGWRWEPTAEERFLADLNSRNPASPAAADSKKPLEIRPGDWPGFRGPNRDGRVPGLKIAIDWKNEPPQLLWKHRIGPGWSSFAVVGNHLFTQDQRGDDEVVVCYHADTGNELWVHKDSARFFEIVAGPGPRATPTFHEGKIYALGGAGRLNCLDALTGNVVWSHDILEDAGMSKPPIWGFSASPLIVQGVVSVFAGGPNGKAVLAYDAATGKLAWAAGKGEASYCSLHHAKVNDVNQLLLNTDLGMAAYHPTTGQVLWEHEWAPQQGMARVVQPMMLDNGDILIGTGFNHGTRCISVSHEGSTWATTERWTTKSFNPYFNDLVLHRGNLYGFDGPFFVCVSLEDAAKGAKKPRWKARGYGAGQVLLLPDQDLLLVLSEKGEVALLEANPDAHKELARIPAIEGKTWNHPVIAHGKLFVRNGEEIACFRLK